ncbi:MAG: undecaprenyl-phosphate glucose phosphotransferase [Rikenellaceae bacterium]
MSQVERLNRLIAAMVVTIDVIVINTLFIAFNFIGIKFFGENICGGNILGVILLLSISYVSSTAINGVVLYHRRVRADQIVVSTLRCYFIFFLIWWFLSLLYLPELSISLLIISYFTFTAFAQILLRLVLRWIIKLYREQGHNSCSVVYLGCAANMAELYCEMHASATTGYRIIGYFDDQPNYDFPGGCKYLGTASEALAFLEANSVDRVYCGLSSKYGKDVIVPIIKYCERNLIRFYSIPNLRNYFPRRVLLEAFSTVPMLSIHMEPISRPVNKVIKRTFDLILSTLFLIVIFPATYLVVGVITKLTSRGPIIFRQKRHGLDGKEFWCYKFRSMVVNDESDTLQASKSDPRITKFGAFLRKTSIDEFPQFINVFLGDMSVVGPRPHMVKHTEEYSKLIDTYMVRHFVKPGITGMAQISGYRGETRNLSDMEHRVRADIWYMEHWTFMLDLYIIFKTIFDVFEMHDENAC